ncbi:radical SAM protein [Sphaerisporangium melleum]|uniref:Radical SAM protein n=1 Tax=Sphaerisporangium melleum TaxID=321316 RepID=A0A917RCZ5_9ACTN|nr:radical SAM protein [Sphaerisporangium melleum]GGL02311.1 radical SAM protein [Sphaerisporangium melleum]GII72234.1 radical SAM protein [Sphaerisporangium melleum]
MRFDALPLVDHAPVSRPRIERRAVRRVLGETTCYEMPARTVIERVPETAGLGLSFAVSPYRGCAHACLYCGARRAHRYLGLDGERDFGSAIVVKTDAARRLRAELASPRWAGETIGVGLSGDCYQDAEEVYRLMPGVLAALRDAGNPFRVMTKSALILRDAELIAEAAEVAEVEARVSIGFVDDRLRRVVEPGAPSAQKRLELCAELGERGVPCGVLMAPILPCLTDSEDQLRAVVRRVAEAGAVSLTPLVLRLPPGAREWYLKWLAEEHPRLVPRYQELYGAGPVAAQDYRSRVEGRVAELARLYGIGARRAPWTPRRAADHQLALL